MNQKEIRECTLNIYGRLLSIVLLSLRRFYVSPVPLIPTDQEAVNLWGYLFCVALWTVKSRDFLKSSHTSQLPDHCIPASGSLGVDSRYFCLIKFDKRLCGRHHCSQLFLLSSWVASNTKFYPKKFLIRSLKFKPCIRIDVYKAKGQSIFAQLCWKYCKESYIFLWLTCSSLLWYLSDSHFIGFGFN